jgi:NADH:ubiquinone oxidoreductase subunit E
MSFDYLQKHILVCAGESCGPQGGAAVRDALKQELRTRGLRKLYRDGECSCMGLCREGVNAVIWPEGTYLAGLTVADVPRLVDYLDGKGPALQELEARAKEKIAIKKGQ